MNLVILDNRLGSSEPMNLNLEPYYLNNKPLFSGLFMMGSWVHFLYRNLEPTNEENRGEIQ